MTYSTLSRWTRTLTVGLWFAASGPAAASGSPVIPQGDVAAQLKTSMQSGQTTRSASRAASNDVSLVNGASFLPQISPGSLVTFFMSDNPAILTTTADSAPFPTMLSTIGLMSNNQAWPLIYVDHHQINAQLPYETPAGNLTATLKIGGATTATYSINVLPSAPGIFLYGNNRAIVQNADYSLNTQTNPAKGGSYLVVYFTGGGPLDNAVPTNVAAPSNPLSHVVSPNSATIGGQPASILFMGLTPGFIGLLQANLQVPTGLTAGDQPVVLTIGGNNSNSPLIAVQ